MRTRGVHHRRCFGSGWAALICLAYAGAALGDAARSTEEPSDRQRASEQFQRGYELSQAGSFEQAARHFEAALALEPAPAVLYNLGQALAASGQPVEALSAFRRALEMPGAISDSLRSRVLQAIRVAEGRIGQVTIRVFPAAARVLLDGQPLEFETYGQPFVVKAGPHTLVSQLQGFETQVAAVEVPAQSHTGLNIVLTPSPVLGYVAVTCAAPEMTLTVDGARQSSATVAPIAVGAGRHSIHLSRPGYLDETLEVDIEPGQIKQLNCRAAVDPTASPSVMGTVVFDSPAAVAVYVDGRRVDASAGDEGSLQTTVRVPIGRHALVLRRTNYEPWRRDIDVGSGGRLLLHPNWTPTPEHREELNAAARVRSNWATIAWGTGAALGVSSAVLGLTAARRHERWLEERHDLNRSSLDDAGTRLRLQNSQARALGIQRLSDAAIGIGVLATGMLGAAATLQWWDRPERETESTEPRSTPSLAVSVGPEEAHVLFAGSL